MSPRQHEPVPVTWSQVAAFRLRRHHLTERAATKALVSVAGDMAGVQAQLLSAAQMSLRTRVRDLEISHLEEAFRKRTLVKAACMRRTLFLVPPGNIAVFVRGTARRAEKEIRWALRKGVPERVVEAAIHAALGALDEPLTRPEIAERTCRRLGVQMLNFQGGGWVVVGSLLPYPLGH